MRLDPSSMFMISKKLVSFSAFKFADRIKIEIRRDSFFIVLNLYGFDFSIFSPFICQGVKIVNSDARQNSLDKKWLEKSIV